MTIGAKVVCGPLRSGRTAEPSGGNRRPGCGRAVRSRGPAAGADVRKQPAAGRKKWKNGKGRRRLAGLGARKRGTRGDFLRAQQGRAQGAKGAGGVRRERKGPDRTGQMLPPGRLQSGGCGPGATVRRRSARRLARVFSSTACRGHGDALAQFQFALDQGRRIRPACCRPPASRHRPALGDLRILQHLDGGGVDAIDHGLRGARRRGQAIPGHVVHLRQAGFPEVRHVRQRGSRRLGASIARARSLPAWIWGMEEGRVVELRVDLAGDHVVQRRASRGRARAPCRYWSAA